VFLAARRRSSCSSAGKSSIVNGLARGIESPISTTTMVYVSELNDPDMRSRSNNALYLDSWTVVAQRTSRPVTTASNSSAQRPVILRSEYSLITCSLFFMPISALSSESLARIRIIRTNSAGS